jgi:hypothetical protein
MQLIQGVLMILKRILYRLGLRPRSGSTTFNEAWKKTMTGPYAKVGKNPHLKWNKEK